MRLALVLAILFLSGCATAGEERAHQARLKQIYESGRQFREQYIAAKRPVFQLKFRHQYPTMSEEEIEVLVNDALKEGLREAGEQERRRLFGGSLMRHPVTRTSSQMGNYTYTDCY